ncbi:cysteine proteinase [Lojkania enalia]|uniref:Cysteine proteinase n=1 Tax=Lojkania enalia TaxID=147567 RepID=A0A9P4NAJ7_9PLEO|nr:cysteine proteinase [Didymosphaeria enalia]
MSAAAPLPPLRLLPGDAMHGFAHGTRSSGPDGWGGEGSGADAGVGDGRGSGSMPSLAEISASASEHVAALKHDSIGRLLHAGRTHYNNAKWRVSTRQGAAAYWEYLVAYHIVVEALPRHPDYYDRIEVSRSEMHREYRDLQKELRSSEEQFMRIKDIIVNENKRAGIHSSLAFSLSRPSSAGSQKTIRTEASNSQGSRLSTSSYGRRDDELMLPDVPSGAPNGRASPADSVDSYRRKPQIHPKPQGLHGRALNQSTASLNGVVNPNDLAERFARLRGPSVPAETINSSAHQEPSIKMPSPTDYQSSNRPMGPRDMPPPHPPKLPLNTQIAASLPKEPSPTYSPARNMSLPPSITAPRSTARSMVGTGGRNSSLAASSISSYAPGANADSDSYFPPQNSQEGPSARRKSVSKPQELQILAEKLYDYIRMYNILLIDVRNREDFEFGHIFSTSVMCVEPTALQDGYSAEQLQDRLVLSPDGEQTMFDQRDKYDLVVYYDQSTKTNAFLHKHNRSEKETTLKRLYDTLYEFNAEKPLKRPPVFLMGGIDAWTDLVGMQALTPPTTITRITNGSSKPARAIRRVPAATDAGRVNLHKRRMREYTTMDPDEERKWMEEARRGRAVFEAPEEDDEELESPMYRSTEEFLRRFPEIEVEQQSMMYPPSRPQPTSQYIPPPIPPAPSRPPPSVPRVSYSGVHERQVAPQGRTTQLPVYVSPGRYGQRKLHRTGLINFGVTCYMNSVVQCLSANMDLTNIFLSGRYARDLQTDNWKGTKGILPEAYATLLSNLYKGDVSSLRPSTFRKYSARMNSQWGIDEQQDAKEFLEFVLDCFHEDLNRNWNRTPLKQLTENEELARERLPRPYVARIEWNRYLHREDSMIGQIFAGQHASQLRCTTCGTTSTTYEAFWSISVEIPRSGQADIRDCLRSYCSTERLAGDDIWRCPRCKQDREATKKITITRAPEYLVMHFKRFSASRTENARKVRTPIHFPLQGLDIGPFMNPPITEQEEAHVISTCRDGPAQLTGLKTDPAMNGPYIYNAYAVIWHIGATLGGGHYMAMVKDKTKGVWRSFNDDKVTDFEPGKLSQENRLQNEKAYIVFYERERVAGGV